MKTEIGNGLGCCCDSPNHAACWKNVYSDSELGELFNVVSKVWKTAVLRTM